MAVGANIYPTSNHKVPVQSTKDETLRTSLSRRHQFAISVGRTKSEPAALSAETSKTTDIDDTNRQRRQRNFHINGNMSLTVLNCIDGRTETRKEQRVRDRLHHDARPMTSPKSGEDDVLHGLGVLDDTAFSLDHHRRELPGAGIVDDTFLQYTDDESEDEDDFNPGDKVQKKRWQQNKVGIDSSHTRSRQKLPPTSRQRTSSDSVIAITNSDSKMSFATSSPPLNRVPPRWKLRSSASL